MLLNIFNLSHNRTAREALIFYGEWVLLSLFVVFIFSLGVNFTLGSEVSTDSLPFWFLVGGFLVTSINTTLSILICLKKGLIKELNSIVLIIFTVILSAIGGIYLGTTIPAFLTMRKGNRHN